MTPDQFRTLGHQMVDRIAAYMEGVGSYPVLSRAAPGEVASGLPDAAPEGPEGWDAIFGDIERVIIPGLTHWQSPSFFAYFPCNASGPAILGELLSAGLNVNGMLWATSPASTELETRLLNWMALATGLPPRFMSGGPGGGCIQGTASESTLIAMVAARARARQAQTGGAAARPALGREACDGSRPEWCVYASAHAHSSVMKAAMILGLARGPEDDDRVRLIQVDDAFRMRPDALESAIRADMDAGRRPMFVCATVGTTSAGAVDPVDEVAAVLARTGCGAWLHVDAAWAGPALLCDEFRWMSRGLDHADSLCMNPHKWMLTNFDCGLFWTADRAAVTAGLSITPEYLRNAATDSGAVLDYRDWQVPLGRRFRALKLWFVMRHYGLEGLRAHIRAGVRMAAEFEAMVRADPRFEVAATRNLSLVCFGLKGDGADSRNRALLDRLNASGDLYLTHTALAGKVVLRLAIGATGTTQRHVARAWARIAGAADGLG